MSRSKGFLAKMGHFTDRRKLTTILIAVLVVLAVIFIFRQNLAKLFSRADVADNVIINKAVLSYIDSQSSPQLVESNIVTTVITTPVPSLSPSPPQLSPVPSLSPSPTNPTSYFTFNKEGWYLFSLKDKPVDAKPETIFGFDCNTMAPSPTGINIDTTLYRWDNATGGMLYWDKRRDCGVSDNPFGELKTGDGYWLQILPGYAGRTITYPSTKITTAQTINIGTTGWAIIGNPFDHTINVETNVEFTKGSETKNWAQAAQANWISCTGYKWNSAADGLEEFGDTTETCWLPSNELGAFQGGWMEMYTDGVSMKIKP